MTEQKLDLLHLATRDVTKPGACAVKIMRRQLDYPCFGGALPR
jgi:hypothetical protein